MGQKKKTLRDKPPAGLPAAQMGSVNTRTSRTGRVIKAPKAFTPPPTAVTTKKRKGGSRKKEANVVCIHCNRGHSPATNAIVFCDGCNNTWHQKCHDPPIDNQVILVEDMEWHCGKCKPAPRPRKDKNKYVQLRSTPTFHPRLQAGPRLEVGGDCFTADERRAYLSSLSHAQLIELLVKITSEYPSVPMLPANMKALPASQFFLKPTNNAPATSTTTASALTKSSGKRTRADQDPFDDGVPTNPPKRSRTTSIPKKGLGDIPFGDDDAVATSTTTASAPTKSSDKRTRADQDPSDADASTDPPKRARTTSAPKKWKGDIPFEPSVRPNASTSQSGYGPIFSSSSDDPTTSDDDDDDDLDENAVEDHRLYPKAGNGFAPALQTDDHKILDESSESQTFSHSMHGRAKEAKESNVPAPVWPSHK